MSERYRLTGFLSPGHLPWLRHGEVYDGKRIPGDPPRVGGLVRLYNPDNVGDFFDVDPRIVEQVDS